MGCSFFCSTVSEFFGRGVQSTFRSVRSKRGPRTGVALVENLATEWPILILILGWNAITSHHIGNRRDPSFESSFRPPFFPEIRFFCVPGPVFFAKVFRKKWPSRPRKNRKTPPPPPPRFFSRFIGSVSWITRPPRTLRTSRGALFSSGIFRRIFSTSGWRDRQQAWVTAETLKIRLVGPGLLKTVW